MMRIIAAQPEPFNVHDVEPKAPCPSSVNHFLKMWVDSGWLAIVEPGGVYRDHHFVHRTYRRTELFGDADEYDEHPHQQRPPRLIVTEFDKRYFEFRATLNLPDHSNEPESECLLIR